MIKRIIFSLLLIGLIGGCMVTASLSAQAGSNIVGTVCNGNNNTGSSAVCTDTNKANGNPTANPVIDRFQKITLIVAYVAGAAAVLMILAGSIKYITSAGDSNKISSAKNTIIYALIGVIVIVLAASIIEFVVTKIK
jgi:hypothetical protein